MNHGLREAVEHFISVSFQCDNGLDPSQYGDELDPFHYAGGRDPSQYGDGRDPFHYADGLDPVFFSY